MYNKIVRILIVLYSTYVYFVLSVLILLVLPYAFFCHYLFPEVIGDNKVVRASRLIIRIFYFLIGIKYQEIQLHTVKTNDQYVIVANHISYLDIPQQLLSVRQPVRGMGDVMYGSIPIFGFLYKRTTIGVDRKDLTSRLQSFKKVKAMLAMKVSVFIYPEGTFNKTQDNLKEFFDGPFIVAIQNNTPILPLVFLDNFKRMNNDGLFTLTPGRSRTVFLEPIPVSGLTMKDVTVLKERTFNSMSKAIDTYR